MKEILKKILRFPQNMIDGLSNLYGLKRWRVNYDASLKLYGKVYISGTGIEVGKYVQINSGYRYNPIGGDERTILRTQGSGRIQIGAHTGISNASIVAYRSVSVGEYVLLGGSCKIYDTDFHSLSADIREKQPDKDIAAKPVVIKDHAFIGAHAIILKGVTIGEGSVIGAGSVVTKSVPDGEIWAGNPAVFIRKVETK